MASSNLMALQATTNRLASTASFAPICADGGMGNATESAVTKALEFVGNNGALPFVGSMLGTASVSEGTKGVALGFSDMLKQAGTGLPAQTVIMQRNQDINLVLGAAADELGLGPSFSSNCVGNTSGGGGGGVFVSSSGGAPVVGPPPGSSDMLGDIARKLGLTKMQATLFLGMMGGVGFLVYKRMKKKGGRR